MPLDLEKISNPFLQAHLQYVEHTEAPRIFHIWAAIACVGACMQRHLYLETGIENIFGNQYVLLVGPPATRKSTAIKAASSLMRGCVDIKIAPDDTGGQRQGFISAMVEMDDAEDGLDLAQDLDIASLMNRPINLRGVNRHVLYAQASEFGSLMGQNNADLARFFIKAWDGDDYTYQLRQHKEVVKDTLMTILGGTTPSDLSLMLPQAAIGQGFMSRLMLVFAPTKDKTVPPSKMRFQRDYEPYIQQVYMRIVNTMRGAMSLAPNCIDIIDYLSAKEIKINDTRFIYYATRRQTHLLKLAMCLAAARDSMEVAEIDIMQADHILMATEERMPEALGEYGLSPIAIARQKMLEFIRHTNEPVSERVLWAVMHRDMKSIDFANSLAELVNADKITLLNIQGAHHYIYKDELTKTLAGLDEDAIDVLMGEHAPQDKLKIN